MPAKSDAVRFSVRYTKEMVQQLELLAKQKHCSVSEIIRGFVETGLTLNSFNDQTDVICQVVSDRVLSKVVPMMDRVIALGAKSSIASGMTVLLCIKAIERLTPPEKSGVFNELYREARLEAVPWTRVMDKDILDALLANVQLYDDESR